MGFLGGAFQSSMMKRTSFFFLVLAPEGLVRHHRTIHSTSASSACPGQGIDLDYCDIEWFALEMNKDDSVVFEIAPKYCISDSFVNYDGYSISSKGFFFTVVDIMVI